MGFIPKAFAPSLFCSSAVICSSLAPMSLSMTTCPSAVICSSLTPICCRAVISSSSTPSSCRALIWSSVSSSPDTVGANIWPIAASATNSIINHLTAPLNNLTPFLFACSILSAIMSAKTRPTSMIITAINRFGSQSANVLRLAESWPKDTSSAA